MSKQTSAPRLPECLCTNLRMSARAITQIYDDVLRPSGLRTTQFSLLRAIERLGPVTFQRLSEALVLDQSTLPRSLRLLERAGYIKIEAGADRRERLASLTAGGEAAIRGAKPLWLQAQERMRSRFRPERLEGLIAELAEMRRAAVG